MVDRLFGYEQAVRLVSLFSLPASVEPAFKLLYGLNPDTDEWLSRDRDLDRLWPHIRWTRREQLSSVPGAELWLRYFPELLESGEELRRTRYRRLWKRVLNAMQVHRLAYSFRQPHDFDVAKRLERERKQIQSDMANDQRVERDIRGQDWVIWTSSWPGNGPPAQLIEEHAGLSAHMKCRLGLTKVEPGLLLNYLHAREIKLEEALTPRQFEELVGTIFREEGWSVELTQQTRDGGKDVVAYRTGGDAPEYVYVEAKRYREDRAVSLSDVKEFTATLAGDEVERGFLVTTSHLSFEAKNWTAEKGANLARVESVGRKDLIRKLGRLSGRYPGVFEL